MDYRDEVFISVAVNLSFSKAAKDLFISQPAVTKHVKELERKMNVALFDRKGNKIFLTKAGKLCYRSLVKIRQAYRDMEFDIGLLENSFKGELRIGASSTISQYLIPKLIAAFHRKYPKIKIDLFNGNSFQMEQKLLNNEIDLAFVENASSQGDLIYHNFIEDEIVVVTGVNSVFAKQKILSLETIQEIPMVLREKGSGTLEVIENSFLQKGVDLENLNIFIHLGSTESIKNFLCDFDGIALVSEKSIEKELALKNIQIIKIKDLSIIRKFRWVFRKGPDLVGANLFTEFISEYNL